MVLMLDQVLTDAAEAGAQRGRDRHGAPRPAERAGPHRGRQPTRRSWPSSRPGAAGRGSPEGRLRRREVPPRRGRAPSDAGRHGAEHDAVAEPQPPRGGQPGRRGPRPRPADATAATPVVAVDRQTTLPILIHGDAAFAARAWWRRPSTWRGWPATPPAARSTSSPTTRSASPPDPTEGRSTTYSSDLAKGFDAPIIHVNADDPEACLAAARLAMDVPRALPRGRGDRPGRLPALRPQRGRRPRLHPAAACTPRSRSTRSVRELYGQGLVKAGVVSQKKADAGAQTMARDLAERQAAVRKQHAEPQLDRGAESMEPRIRASRRRRSSAEPLQRLNQQLYRWPATFHINTKLAKQLAKRRRAGRRRAAHRVGARRGAGLRLAAGRGRPDPPHRPGHRARHLQPAPPDAVGRQDRRALHAHPAP